MVRSGTVSLADNSTIFGLNTLSVKFEISLKGQWKVIKMCSKIVAKTVPNHGKSTSGAVLEDFGDPLGAQVAQERQQELKNSKNVGFEGRPGVQNGPQIDTKSG